MFAVKCLSLFHHLHKVKEIYPDSVIANREGRLFFASLTILFTGTIPSLHSELKFRLMCAATCYSALLCGCFYSSPYHTNMVHDTKG